MFPFHSFHVNPKQDYLHSIHFHSFPFLYFKTSNQGYLIPFHSFPFLSLTYIHSIPFHSFPFLYNHSIPFYSLPLWTPKRSLRGSFSMVTLMKPHLLHLESSPLQLMVPLKLSKIQNFSIGICKIKWYSVLLSLLSLRKFWLIW